MATYNTQWEHSLFAEINRARTQPQVLAAELEGLRSNFDGVYYKLPNDKALKTTEGVAALNGAIRYLERASPIPAFRGMSEGLSKSAHLLIEDNGPKGLVGNTLSDGTPAAHRWVRFGQWKGKVGENICFNMDDPREIVYQWLIDDGNGNRPNRASMMDEAFTVVGISHGPHSTYNSMVVVTFALGFTDGAPGYVAQVGQSRNGSHTVQSTDRKTEEATLTGTGDNFVIQTDDLEADNTENLKLSAKGKILTLSKTFMTGGKTKRKNLQWQLPFSFSPSSVRATFQNGEVTIVLPKPTPEELQGNANIAIGEYQLQANLSGEESIHCDVKKVGTKFVLTVSASKQAERVAISFRADVITVNSLTANTTQPFRMPFVLSQELIDVTAEPQKIVLKLTKPGETEAVTIPIQ